MWKYTQNPTTLKCVSVGHWQKLGREIKASWGLVTRWMTRPNPPFFLQFETSRGASGLSSISALCVSPACRHLLKPDLLSWAPPPFVETGSLSPRMSPDSLVPCQAISSIYFLMVFHGHICQPRQVPPASRGPLFFNFAAPYTLYPALLHSRCTESISWNQWDLGGGRRLMKLFFTHEILNFNSSNPPKQK